MYLKGATWKGPFKKGSGMGRKRKRRKKKAGGMSFRGQGMNIAGQGINFTGQGLQRCVNRRYNGKRVL